MIKFDTSHAHLQENIFDYQQAVTLAHTQLHEKSGAGNDFVGWVEWPNLKESRRQPNGWKVSATCCWSAASAVPI